LMPSHLPSKPLSEVFRQALLQAEKQGVPAHKVKLLLAEITESSLPSLLLDKDKYLTPEQSSSFELCLQRLVRHEPIQYILGKAEFYGLTLQVNEHVLIPRPETEGLVEWVFLQNRGQQNILDIGTGSGAIAIALKHLNPDYRLSATDISSAAVRLAQSNAGQLGLTITFYQADLFPPKPAIFDVIVSNPPYISTSEYMGLDDEVQLYEPKLALIAGKDGLSVYRRILAQAKQFLKPGGRIYLEIGETQAKDIADIALKHGFKTVDMKQDLAGRDRYLRIET